MQQMNIKNFLLNVLTCKLVNNVLSPCSPYSVFYLGLATHSVLSLQENNIENSRQGGENELVLWMSGNLGASVVLSKIVVPVSGVRVNVDSS